MKQARFQRRATTMSNTIDRIELFFNKAVARSLKPEHAAVA